MSNVENLPNYSGRYELRDSHYPTERGMRYSDFARAERALATAVGEPGRFFLFDRVTRKPV